MTAPDPWAPDHSLSITHDYPGDCITYRPRCTCGWQGATHRTQHVCTPATGVACTDLDGWYADMSATAEAARQEGRAHLAGKA